MSGWHLWRDCSQIYSQAPVGSRDWLPDACAGFAATVLSPALDYPCHFGVQGQQRGHNWFTAFDTRFPGNLGIDALAQSILQFRDHAWTGPRRQSLVVFVGPPEPAADLADHHRQFWSLLTDLSTRDQAPWPAEVPPDTAHPQWQWCFGGEPWFAFVGSPGYRARRSRNLGPCLTLVLQTRRVFEGIGGATLAGQTAKRRVRERLLRYDRVPPHPCLGDEGHSSTHKWRQYALPDDQRIPAASGCPLAVPGRAKLAR